MAEPVLSDLWAVYALGNATYLRVTEGGEIVGAAGAIDLGTTTLEIGDVYLGDDKGLFFGDDQDGKIEYDEDGTDQMRVTGADWLFVDADLLFIDAQGIILGTGSDDTIKHSGTATLWTHATGDLTFDNTATTGSTICLLGTDTTAVDFQVQNNSAAALFSVTPASASTGTTKVVGTLDLDGDLDLDTAFGTAPGTAAIITATSADADGAATGLFVEVAQITNVRTSTRVAAIKAKVTSLSGDTSGVDYACFEASVVAGEAGAEHTVLYSEDAFDFFMMALASGDGGVTVAANGMTADPESAQEAGYISIDVAGTGYQIPFYGA